MQHDTIVENLLLDYLNVRPDDLRIVSIPSGVPEAEVVFTSNQAYHEFWMAAMKDLERGDNSRLRDLS